MSLYPLGLRLVDASRLGANVIIQDVEGADVVRTRHPLLAVGTPAHDRAAEVLQISGLATLGGRLARALDEVLLARIRESRRVGLLLLVGGTQALARHARRGITEGRGLPHFAIRGELDQRMAHRCSPGRPTTPLSYPPLGSKGRAAAIV